MLRGINFEMFTSKYNFFERIEGGEYDKVKKSLAKHPEYIRARKFWGGEKITPLLFACLYGDLRLVKLFLKNGADLSESSKHMNTAVHYAAYSGNISLIDFILKKKRSLADAINQFGENCLFMAAKQGHISMIFHLVENYNLNPNVCRHDQMTLLHKAAYYDKFATVYKLSIKFSSLDPYAKDEKGLSILHYATLHSLVTYKRGDNGMGDTSTVEKLCKHYSFDIKQLQSVLELKALKRYQFSNAKLLFTRACDFFSAIYHDNYLVVKRMLKDFHYPQFSDWLVLDGDPPLLWAIKKKRRNMASLLVSNGSRLIEEKHFLKNKESISMYNNVLELNGVSKWHKYSNPKRKTKHKKLENSNDNLAHRFKEKITENHQLKKEIQKLKQQLESLDISTSLPQNGAAITPCFDHDQSLTTQPIQRSKELSSIKIKHRSKKNN